VGTAPLLKLCKRLYVILALLHGLPPQLTTLFIRWFRKAYKTKVYESALSLILVSNFVVSTWLEQMPSDILYNLAFAWSVSSTV
jgi:hypothetical protein